VVRDLGVLLDSELTLKQPISKVASCCHYHIRRLRHVSRFVRDIMMQLTSVFILSRLDYCNIILAGLPKSSIATLQRVQNAAARLVLGLGPRDHIVDGLRQLHWLPVEVRIRYKMCLLMHMVTLSTISQRRSTSSFFFIWSFQLGVGNNGSICEAQIKNCLR